MSLEWYSGFIAGFWSGMFFLCIFSNLHYEMKRRQNLKNKKEDK